MGRIEEAIHWTVMSAIWMGAILVLLFAVTGRMTVELWQLAGYGGVIAAGYISFTRIEKRYDKRAQSWREHGYEPPADLFFGELIAQAINIIIVLLVLYALHNVYGMIIPQ